MSAFLGADPTDGDVRGICDWVLGGDVIYLCPEGLKAFAKGAARLLDEKEVHERALQNWRDCYPEDVFIPLTEEQLREVVALLKANGWTPAAVFAHWGRHIVGCLDESLARAAA